MRAARLAVLAAALAAAAVSTTVTPARAAAAAPPLTGFLSEPTEQLAVPGDLPSGEITPQGDVYTGWAEYEPSTGPDLVPWDQPTRITPDPALPLYDAERREGPVSYAERVFTTAVAGEPVAYLTFTARNLTNRRRPARVAMQLAYDRGAPIPTYYPSNPASPYRFPRGLGAPGGDGADITDLGVAFDPAWAYATRGRDVTRDSELLLRGPAAPSTALPTTGDGLSSPHARRAYAATLPAHGAASFTWQIPLDPPAASPLTDAALDADPLATAQAAFTAAWRRMQAGEMSVTLPEARIDDVYHESLVDILAARDESPQGWYQAVNKLQYQGFWLRDSSIMTVALDQAGLHAIAGQNLQTLGAWQQPDGLYISQSGQFDGVGEALWETAEHALLTHRPAAAAAALGPVTAAVGWISDSSAADPDGLLGPTTITDDEQLTDARVTGDELWAAVGLRSAVAIARLAGRSDLASAWQAIDARFEAHLRAALSADLTAHGHITPGLGTAAGDDWGNYDLDYPDRILPPHGAAVTATIDWERAHSEQGLADFARPGFLHDYLGFPIFEAELQRGGPSVAQALNGLYSETLHTTASGGGWEDGPRGTRVRASTDNLSPHGTFSGQYVSLLHNLLVDDTGSGIDLLAGVSPAWLAPGDRIAVSRAATSAGPVSLTLTALAHGATLHWSIARFPGSTEPLAWVTPYWTHPTRTVTLQGDHGTVTVHWTGRRPGQSLAGATAALNRVYRRSGHAAPIVPAPNW